MNFRPPQHQIQRTPMCNKILFSHHTESNNSPASAATVQEQPPAYASTRKGHQVSKLMPPWPGPCIGCTPQPHLTNPKAAMFCYHCTTKTNAVKFMRQNLCNPSKLLLIKAINAGFLKGAPHLSTKLLRGTYLLAWQHQKVIWNSHAKDWKAQPPSRLIPHNRSSRALLWPKASMDDSCPDSSSMTRTARTGLPYKSISNVFCFGAFADKNTSVVYNNCTGTLPFMSLDGNVCFFAVYHY